MCDNTRACGCHKTSGGASSAASAAGSIGSGIIGGAFAVVGFAVALTLVVWFVKLILPWLLAAAGIAAAVWVTRVVLRLRRHVRALGRRQRQRAVMPAPDPAAIVPRTTVDAVKVRAIEHASSGHPQLRSRAVTRASSSRPGSDRP